MAGLADQRRAADPRGTLRRLWQYLRPRRAALGGVVALVVAGMGLEVWGPYLMGQAIDRHILPRDLTGLTRLLGLMLFAYLAMALVGWLRAFAMAGLSQLTVRDLRRDLFARLQVLTLRYLDQHRHGELMSRLTNDVDNVSMVMNEAISELAASVLGLVGMAVMMFVLNWRLALVSLVTIPGMIVLAQVVGRRTLAGFRAQQEALGALNGLIEESVTGSRVTKAFGREAAAVAQFEAANQELRTHATRAQTLALVMAPATNMVNNVAFACIVVAGVWMAIQGWVTVGTIAVFMSYIRRFMRPLGQMAQMFNSLQSAVAGAERVFAVLAAPSEALRAPAAIPPVVRGEVVFDRVTFGYEPGQPVLRDISLRAPAGCTLALVGPTGAGKTTIVNLLTRFYEPDAGTITLDGQDIRRLPLADLRRQLGIVLQDTFLFAASVLDNLRYGRPEATDEEVRAAARLANADGFIRRLPAGYDRVLTEEGHNLSQGQRQLLAIARAMLADPRILILDEATSSVDTRTEVHIQQAMLRLMRGRTSLVIAHRLSTIRAADQILVLDQGRIVERGAHAELLAAGGTYARLYQSQYAGLET